MVSSLCLPYWQLGAIFTICLVHGKWKHWSQEIYFWSPVLQSADCSRAITWRSAGAALMEGCLTNILCPLWCHYNSVRQLVSHFVRLVCFLVSQRKQQHFHFWCSSSWHSAGIYCLHSGTLSSWCFLIRYKQPTNARHNSWRYTLHSQPSQTQCIAFRESGLILEWLLET